MSLVSRLQALTLSRQSKQSNESIDSTNVHGSWLALRAVCQFHNVSAQSWLTAAVVQFNARKISHN